MKKYYKRLKMLEIFLILIMIIMIINASIFLGVLPNYSEIKQQFYPDYEILRIKEPVYIMPYTGDIDGEVSEDWFFFYERITDFHDKNEIPVTFSFYPASIGDEDFNKIFLEMYESRYIELMQKSYKGERKEMEMYKLPMEEQKEIIKTGQDVFRDRMKEIIKKENGKLLNQVLGKRINSNVKMPIAYNQIGGIINNDTETAMRELGFKIYFDMFVAEGFAPVESDENFDVMEYGISFTKTGRAGKENIFNTPLEISSNINNFDREDVTVMVVNGRKVIPLWVHQQDFESMEKENKLDRKKWNIYVYTLKALKKDSNVEFITPNELYYMRHGKSVL